MSNGVNLPAAVVKRTRALVLAILVIGSAAASGCGSSGATNPTATSSSTKPQAAPEAPCTIAAAMAGVRLVYDRTDTQAVVAPGGGDMKCASGIAKIGVLIGAKNPPANGPQGSPHLVLLEDRAGTWVVANDKLCGSNGQPLRAIPAALGTVCGVQ
jgi:hypothetical protein